MKKIIRLVLTFTLLSFSGLPQKNESAKNSGDIRLVKNNPSVFISYERHGKRKPFLTGESEQGVWLRLHNNTKWQIVFPVFDVPSELGDVGVFYEVESENKDVVGEQNEVPKGYPLDEVHSTVRLGPGKSVLFSAPYEHLNKGLKLRIRFSYEWENQDDVFADREVFHFVYFRSSSLPQTKRN